MGSETKYDQDGNVKTFNGEKDRHRGALLVICKKKGEDHPKAAGRLGNKSREEGTVKHMVELNFQLGVWKKRTVGDNWKPEKRKGLSEALRRQCGIKK